ncbi:MAG: VOC family protein [Gemmatimonadota bacterium]|nr:VOC family protein [Gemmatimonadota bacterium]
MKKITPIITVEAIEPCLLFWTGLGFKVTAEVPHEDTIGFAMLHHGALEIMYQSHASIEADLGASGAPEGLGGELARSTITLFIEVDSITDVLDALGEDIEIVVPRRETFYGMDEIFVRAPCGTVVGFAAKVEDAGEN